MDGRNYKTIPIYYKKQTKWLCLLTQLNDPRTNTFYVCAGVCNVVEFALLKTSLNWIMFIQSRTFPMIWLHVSNMFNNVCEMG